MLPLFEWQSPQVNNLLLERNLFLGVYKLRKKFRYLIKKYPSKNEVVRDLLAYVEERFNGFDIVKNKQKRKKRRRVSVEWHCLPTSEKNEEFIDCYFTDSVHKAYRATISWGKIKRWINPFEFMSVFCLQ